MNIITITFVVGSALAQASVIELDLTSATDSGFGIQYQSVRSISTDNRALMDDIYDSVCRLKVDHVPFVEGLDFEGHTASVGTSLLYYYGASANPVLPAEYFVHNSWVEDFRVFFSFANQTERKTFRLSHLGPCE